MQTCLIIEDDATGSAAERKMVERLGFQAREAADVQTALNLFAEDVPDLILLDWMMPELSGLDFLQTIRETKIGRAPKVVMCSALCGRENIEKSMQAGADAYITKPFDIRQLQAKLTEMGVIHAS